jgi:hypothetical protein
VSCSARLASALVAALAVFLPGSAMSSPASDPDQPNSLAISVISSRPDQVSGGDALVRVDAREDLLDKLRIERNGEDVTDAFGHRRSALVGLVDGLEEGHNTITAESPGGTSEELELVNYPITGPIFSGPQQEVFVCKTIQAGLGEPLVDNEDEGFRVRNPDGSTAGYSRDCSAETKVDYLYRSTATGRFEPLPPGGERPADLAQTELLDGRTVDYVVRRERGTINRFIYSFAMLAPIGEDSDEPDLSRWNRRLIYTFDGGVAIGHNQGTPGGSALYDNGLSKGYAILHSSGTRTSTHYNLELGGETALMTKEEFIERYGVPRYTVGVGGSGGAIQQYVYGQNHPGLIDAGIPQYSYPDMVTQTIHVGDCELLEYYMDVTDAANPTWRNWENREWLEGLNTSSTVFNPYTRAPGSTECIRGWRGLTPLAMNPLFHPSVAGDTLNRMDPAVMASTHWTHWEDLRNIYGVGENGYARQTWDNVGVQYGLQALTDGHITPEEFLDLNAQIGSWKDPQDMVQEGRPFLPSGPFDPWSSRNMRLSPDGGVTPAPRREGDVAAMNAAYNRGLYFDGDIDIPLIDWRHYLEEELDMHNSHQSFVSRRRMLDHDGDASNQAIWFTDARPSRQSDQTPQALAVIDTWINRIRAHPERSVAENAPPQATDRCFTTEGEEIARGPQVWAGILDDEPDGPCTQRFPLHSTSRIVAGGPFRGGVYKCALQPVETAVARGVYGPWSPTPAQVDRLEEIFPSGVCDYPQGDVGRP